MPTFASWVSNAELRSTPVYFGMPHMISTNLPGTPSEYVDRIDNLD
jgi:hypothetical protein